MDVTGRLWVPGEVRVLVSYPPDKRELPNFVICSKARVYVCVFPQRVQGGMGLGGTGAVDEFWTSPSA